MKGDYKKPQNDYIMNPDYTCSEACPYFATWPSEENDELYCELTGVFTIPMMCLCQAKFNELQELLEYYEMQNDKLLDLTETLANRLRQLGRDEYDEY